MSFNEEAVKAKLAAVDGTQESIMSIGQWLLFHRRHANAIVKCWHDGLAEASSNRKLNLIYLANEVAQQSKAKRRTEYPEAFGGVMAHAVQHVMRHVTADVQGKIRRVVDVWRQRNVFSVDVLQAIDNAVQASSSSRTGSRAASKGSGTQGLTVPSELRALAESYKTLSELMSSMSLASGTTEILLSTAEEGVGDSSPQDTLTKLDQVDASLSNVRKIVEEAIATRTKVIDHLQTLIQTNYAAEEAQSNTSQSLEKIAGRVATLRAQATEQNARSTTPEMEPPTIEALTPPPGPIVPAADDPASRMEVEMGPDLAAILSKITPTSTIVPDGTDHHDGVGAGDVDEDAYVP
ncbi:hypothetical protein PYCC9005_000552 [Savitreella phatthalungensis]